MKTTTQYGGTNAVILKAEQILFTLSDNSELVGGYPDHEATIVELASAIEFERLLKLGKVKFTFRRNTYGGASRQAIGTTNIDYISTKYAFAGGGTLPPQGLVRYWDLGTGTNPPVTGWRSFYIQNVESYELIETL
jgi:hypothetical protein